MTTATKELLTVRQIAQEAGVELHKVQYIARTRKIPSARRVGVFRMYDRKAANQIVKHFRRTRSDVSNN